MIRLEPGNIHIWTEELDEELEPTVWADNLAGILSSDEFKRAGAFRFEKDRHRFISARVILRSILSYYVGMSPESLVFSYGLNGKPELDLKWVQFNVSHSANLGVFAVSHTERVGIDVEHIRSLEEDELTEISRRYFPREEIAQLKNLPMRNKLEYFYRNWTILEATLKLEGSGFNELPDLESGHSIYSKYFVKTFDVKPQYMMSLASAKAPRRIVEFDKNACRTLILSRNLALPHASVHS